MSQQSRDRKRANQRKAKNLKSPIRAQILKKLTEAKELTEDEAKLLLSMKIEDTKMTVDNIERSVRIFLHAVNGIVGEFNCLQIQRIGMDLESILQHTEDLKTNGPKAAHKEIAMEDSEVADDAPENVLPMGVERE